MNTDNCVLLIDDELDTLKLYKLKLALDGYQVITATEGSKGIERASTEKPKVIVLDLKMPGMDGFEVLKNLQGEATTKNIPKIILSNFDNPRVIENCLQLGAKEYLVKSQVTPEEVSAVITRQIEKPL